MVRLGLRNLFQSRVHLLISVGGVALALTLVLVLDAIFAGSGGQLTAVIEHSGADVWVAQAGVRTLHMSSSALPAATLDAVRAVPGVAAASPLLYVTTSVRMGSESTLAYVFGVPADAVMGQPWRVVAGTASPGPGEIVVDRALAARAGIGLGDAVQALGTRFRVAGLSEGTTTITNTSVYIALDDFARLRSTDTVSYILVRAQPGVAAATLAARIQEQVGGVTAQSRQAFAQQERRLVSDMSTDVLAIMDLAGFVTGLAVLALTVYTATLSRRTEYGVLKALGARNRQLYRAVLTQAAVSVGLGLALAVALALLLTVVVPQVASTLALSVDSGSVLKTGAVSLTIAGLAALLPIRQIAGLDPAAVFRRR